MSNNNGLRTQYPYQGDALSPRLPYDFPSPSSNYPSGVGAPSPGFYPMAYQISPRFGTSAFIPPPDIFLDSRRDNGANGAYTPLELKKRNSEVLNSDPVAMHLLVETAIGDSQYFDILSVEEVESMKQEQKTLDSRLGTVRRKLESETKIRDAARSLTRLTSTKEKGHRRGLSSKGGNAVKDTYSRSEEELEASNRKVENLTRELLEIESRMRTIDMQLLMHTAAVLQLTHKGPKQRKQSVGVSNSSVQRPDSPASMDTYDVNRGSKDRDTDIFDERSLYRSAENLDSLMNALQNGTFNQSSSLETRNAALTSMGKRLEELNERVRELIVQANPQQNQEYSLPPQASDGAVDAQLDFLDQGLRDISAEQANLRGNSRHSSSEVEGRLEVINNQLYNILGADGQNETRPPPRITGGGAKEQLNYMEESFYNLEQAQYTLNQQLDQMRSQENALSDQLNQLRAKESDANEELAQMRSKASTSQEAERYETTLMGLWQIIISGEEEARERKRERRRQLANDPEADEELSPDEDAGDEEFSLAAFSAKVQWLYGRASTLKDKQSILIRQIKQQRELNSKSDAQKEAEFERLNEQVRSARTEKMTIEEDLERAMGQLRQFDEQKTQTDSQALRDAQQRSNELEAALADVQGRLINLQNELNDTQERSNKLEKQLKESQERNEVEARAISTRSTENDSKVREAQDRADALEIKLKEVEDDARVEAATIQAELSQAATKINEATAALQAATAEKEAAEARSAEATKSLTAKEEELRDLEGEVVRLTTELTFAKAELDGAYGSRAERAAESAANPAIKRELDELAAKNIALLGEVEALRKVQDVASQSEAEARESERNLKAELSGMAAEYEALTRDAIQNEKDRDVLEAQIEKLRDEKEALELELSDERVKFLGLRSPSVANGGATPGGTDMGATSIRMLREDFRKMMRDRTAEGLKALRAEQEERRKLESQLRQLRKDASPQKSGLSKSLTAA